ncbi:MAG TPA: carboxymuconolactone decarboxylase family protein [Gammaproteobacteria bacterium]|nr:carboxymuconolactone decarboxylase family protein [Gammaproteobacteria bacterium]
MKRIPYAAAEFAVPAELLAAIVRRRGGALLNLDRMLLHSPPLARGWNEFLGALRGELAVPAPWRELAMCHVAVLNGADYEYAHHAPLFLAAGGRQAVLDAIARGTEAPSAPALAPDERALLQLTLEMTREIAVRDATRAAARAALANERELVEFIAVVAAYNMVSRFLVATGVTLED